MISSLEDLERYLAAAIKIAPVAVGTYADGPVETTYSAPGDYSQIRHVEGLPFGTRGGLLIKHTLRRPSGCRGA